MAAASANAPHSNRPESRDLLYLKVVYFLKCNGRLDLKPGPETPMLALHLVNIYNQQSCAGQYPTPVVSRGKCTTRDTTCLTILGML